MGIYNDTLNIPTISVSDMVRNLSGLYTEAIRKGLPFKSLLTPFLWGPPGIGKTTGVYELGKKLEEMTGRRVIVKAIRLPDYTPEDFLGFPVVNRENKTTEWYRPEIFNFPDRNALYILFLDELSTAPLSLQTSAYQICQDYSVSGHSFPDNVLVIAAGNRLTDQSVSYKMSKALCNRLVHFNVESDFESWKDWALRNGINEKIIGFLSFANNRLNTTPESSDLAYATPRTWEAASKYLDLLPDDPAMAVSFISGCVGNDIASEFTEWCHTYSVLPKISDVFRGTCRFFNKSQDVMFALVSSLTTAVYSKRNTITPDELENVCSFVATLPPDHASAFFTDLFKITELYQKLTKCRAYNAWYTSSKYM